jgi:NRAMP (natural resistance-associated macrophage protein)-like metal ion transporter
MERSLTNKLSPARWRRVLAAMGPGLLVMLADTDAGSIITAAQSGAQWGYKLLALQFVLIPILYIVQELALRLGLATGRGHGELIRTTFGKGWAWFSVSSLLLACIGAIVTELSGIAGVASLFGISVPLAMAAVVGSLIVMIWTGSYLTVERGAIVFGLFEFAFVFVAWRAHPDGARIAAQLLQMPLANPGYLYLIAANLGAVIMPWMVFYHQSAVLDKGLGTDDLIAARWDTALGAVVTQLIMAAVLIAVAATVGQAKPDTPLNDVPEIARVLILFLGGTTGRLVFAAGMTGAALVATVVVCLAAAWGVGEVAGFKRSLEHRPSEAPWFYGILSASLIAGGVLVASGINLVKLSVAVEVMNALLLPIVLGFLYLLALRALPGPYQLKGPYRWLVGAVVLLTSVFGVYAGIAGALGS